jgi:hypothetical protein
MIRIGKVTIKTEIRPKLIEFARVLENGQVNNALFTVCSTQIINDVIHTSYTRTA